jgi:2-dehydropantoate 2-reductase
MSIAVLGTGGVGGFVAAALARADEAAVTVVALEQSVAVIARDGISVRSVRLGDFTVRPAAVAQLTTDADVLLVTPKATSLVDALDRIAVAPRLVVPLLNGLDQMARLRERFDPATVAAGVIRVEADRPARGVIVQTSPFLRIDLASGDRALRPALEDLATTLENAGIPATVGASEVQVLWGKLVRLNALACTTSAWDVPLGEIRDDPERRAALEACVTEAAAVARAEGADIADATVMDELEEAHATLGSSMQRDIAAGREPELDQIAGGVLRAAARHGKACPTIERLAGLVAERAGIDPPHGTLAP